MAGLLAASRAFTVKLKGFWALTLTGADAEKCVAALEPTMIEFEVPVIECLIESVTVMVWLPKVFSVAGKFPTPNVNVKPVGRTAWLSLLVRSTFPL
jgi:hypothetical protein